MACCFNRVASFRQKGLNEYFCKCYPCKIKRLHLRTAFTTADEQAYVENVVSLNKPKWLQIKIFLQAPFVAQASKNKAVESVLLQLF